MQRYVPARYSSLDSFTVPHSCSARQFLLHQLTRCNCAGGTAVGCSAAREGRLVWVQAACRRMRSGGSGGGGRSTDGGGSCGGGWWHQSNLVLATCTAQRRPRNPPTNATLFSLSTFKSLSELNSSSGASFSASSAPNRSMQETCVCMCKCVERRVHLRPQCLFRPLAIFQTSHKIKARNDARTTASCRLPKCTPPL